MNRLHPLAAQLFLMGGMSWSTGTWKVVALDDGYVFDVAHEHLDDIDPARRVATSPALTGRTATGGVADADDSTLEGAAPGITIRSLWLYWELVSEATSPLVAFMDTTSAGVPISLVTTGDTIALPWPTTTNKIFRL